MTLDPVLAKSLYSEAALYFGLAVGDVLEEIMEEERTQDPDFIVTVAEAGLGTQFGLSRVVATMLSEGLLDRPLAGALAVRAWHLSSSPLSSIPIDTWRELFGLAGFTLNGKSSQRPTEPVTLYRGCGPGGEHGWSWTSDPDIAQVFAGQFSHLGQVHERQWEPEHLLAQFDPTVNSEQEWVVDTGEDPSTLCCLVEGQPGKGTIRDWTATGVWRPGYPDVIMVGDSALAFLDFTAN